MFNDLEHLSVETRLRKIILINCFQKQFGPYNDHSRRCTLAPLQLLVRKYK